MLRVKISILWDYEFESTRESTKLCERFRRRNPPTLNWFCLDAKKRNKEQ